MALPQGSGVEMVFSGGRGRVISLWSFSRDSRAREGHGGFGRWM